MRNDSDRARLAELYRRGEVEQTTSLWAQGLSAWVPLLEAPGALYDRVHQVRVLKNKIRRLYAR